jgi:PKD repeat protein
VRTSGTGPTQIQAWVWRGGTPEPTAAALTRSDVTAALQIAGGVGLTVHRPGGTTAATDVRFTGYQVTGAGGGVPADVPPTASFTATPSGLQVAVDGAASADPDGTIASYAWSWGDGTTAGSGQTATHTYAAAGTYTVTLTVTDNGGATATATRSVTVTAPAGPAPIASDTFARTVTGGLGSADVGGAWTAAAGATRLAVTPGRADFSLPAAGNNTGAYLGGVSQTGADLRTTVALTTAPTGNGTYAYVTGRRVAGQGEYRVRIRFLANGTVGLALSRLTGTTEAFPGGELIVPGVTYTPGTALNVRVQVTGTGTTQVRATVWTAGTEPATPQMTRTDTTAALQAAGGVGLAAHRPSGTTAATVVRFTGFTVTPVA